MLKNLKLSVAAFKNELKKTLIEFKIAPFSSSTCFTAKCVNLQRKCTVKFLTWFKLRRL
jgi:hypothetical protein